MFSRPGDGAFTVLTVRARSALFRFAAPLQRAKEIDPAVFTKSGIMIGLGGGRNEVLQVMDDLRIAIAKLSMLFCEFFPPRCRQLPPLTVLIVARFHEMPREFSQRDISLSAESRSD